MEGIRGKFRAFCDWPGSGPYRFDLASRTDQSGRANSRTGADCDSADIVQHAAADAIVSAMQIMPATSRGTKTSRGGRLSEFRGDDRADQIDLSSSRQTLRPFYEMNYVLVPDNQPRVTIPFFNYPDESDLDGGTFPNGQLSNSLQPADRSLAEGNRRISPCNNGSRT